MSVRLSRVCCLISILLSSCTTLNGAPGDTSYIAAEIPGPPVERITLRGRAMVKQAVRVDHLRFDWTHDDISDTLLLTTPFGQGVARISRERSIARLQLADGRIIERDSLTELAAAVFGSDLPLGELAEWLRGARAQRHAMSNGWEVTVEHVDTISIGEQTHWLPRTLLITQGDVSMRLVVDDRGAGP